MIKFLLFCYIGSKALTLKKKVQKVLFWFFLFFSFPVWSVVFIEILIWYFLGSLVTIFCPKPYQKKVFYHTKRALDISVSLTLLLMIFPLFLSMIVCNFIALGTPIFFIQPRVGRHNKIFFIIKFRSMCQKNPSGALMSPSEVKLSPYGLFIRSYSLDELPSLWNVFKGDMSLVGPRPLVPEFLTENVPFQRHNVRPGLTGLAQVNGRNLLHWKEKFAYDIAYVHRPSYTLDVKILIRTLGVLCSGEHTYLAPMEKFFP